MARKVNKRFLVILLTVLAIAAVAVTAAYWEINRYQNDPVRLEREAKTYLAAGHVTAAIQAYQRAVIATERQHLPGAAPLLYKVGNLFYKNSAKHEKWFTNAVSSWRAAVQTDPSYMPAQQRLMHVSAKIAEFVHSPAAWDQVRQTADAVIKVNPKDAEAYRVRGEARLSAISGVLSLTDARFKASAADFAMACKLKPTDAKPFANLAGLYLIQASSELAQQTISRSKAESLRKQGMDVMRTFVKKNPNDALGWLYLASLCRSNPALETEGKAAMEQAEKLAPDDPRTYEALAIQLQAQNAPLTSQVAALQRVIQLQPTHMTGYFQLGHLYLQHNDFASAIQYLQLALNHPTAGGGMAPAKNRAMRFQSYQWLTEAYLATGNSLPLGSAARIKVLKKAEHNLARVKLRAPKSPWVILSTGQLQLERGQVTEALATLQQAGALLSPSNSNDVRYWVMDKQLLAQAYEQIGQSGSALEEFKEILARAPNAVAILLNEAALESRVHPHDSLHIVNRVLKTDPNNAVAVAIKAQALAVLDRVTELHHFLTAANTSKSLPLSVLRARVELVEKNYQAAWDALKPWVAKFPSDNRSVIVAYVALMKLNRRSEASALLAKAVKAAPDNLQFILLDSGLRDGKSPQVKLGDVDTDVANITIPGETGDTAQLGAIKSIQNPFQRHQVLANYYLQRKHYKKAGAEIAAAAAIQPHAASVVESEFELAMLSKDYTRASEVAQLAGSLNLDGVNGALYTGRLQMAQGDIAGAVRTLNKALSSDSNSAVLRTYYGAALLKSGNIEAGIAALKQSLHQKPDDMAALKPLIQYYMNEQTPASIARASHLINQGLAYDSLDAQLHQWKTDMADLYGPPGPDIRRRLAIYKNDPTNLENIQRLAFVYARENDYARGISLLKKAYAGNKTNLVIAQGLAKLYVLDKHSNKALRIYTSLAENADPKIAYVGRLRLGDFYRSRGNFAQARQMYQSAAKKQPSGIHVVQARLADMFYQLAHYHQALAYLEPLHKAEPKNRGVLLRYIEALIRSGKVEDGLALLKSEILSKNPRDEAGLTLEALAYLSEKKLDLSAAAINEALAANPNDVQALYNQAVLLSLMPKGDLSQAISDLEVVIAKSPDNIASRLNLAQLYQRTRQYAEAVHEYQSIVRLNPNDSAVRQDYAGLLFGLSRMTMATSGNTSSNLAATLRTINPLKLLGRLIDSSIARFPNDFNWRLMRANLDMMRGQTEAAVSVATAAYRRAGHSVETTPAYLTLLIQAKAYHRAVKVSTVAIALEPNNPGLYTVRAIALSALHQVPQAIPDFNKALELSTNLPESLIAICGKYQAAAGAPVVLTELQNLLTANKGNQGIMLTLAQLQFSSGHQADALNMAEQILSAAPSGFIHITALRVAALSAYDTGHYLRAKTYYRDILKIAPDDANTLNNLAYLLAVKLNQPLVALNYAEKANQIAASADGRSQYSIDPNILDTLGWVRFLNGDIAGAHAALQRAIARGKVATAYYHMANVMIKQNNNVKAKYYLAKAIKYAKEFHENGLKRSEALLSKLKG